MSATQPDYNELSERYAFARTRSQRGVKPALEAFGWIVEGGVFRPGLLFVNETVRSRKLTFFLYEPGDDEKPVKTTIKLGEVDVKLSEHLPQTSVGMAYTTLELEVLDARHD